MLFAISKFISQGARIIVFPEYGLYGLNWTRESIQPYLEYIPDISTSGWNPCDNPMKYSNTDTQRNLSCIAKNSSIFLVANMGARQPCDDTEATCPPDGHYQFSANVVYGSNGDFVGRYFKYNLYAEEKHFDKPNKPDYTIFETPFGKFGTFSSSDILYHEPAVHLVKSLNITNIAYPTAWQDKLPLMAAIEFHSAYAEGMQINLLAANLHIPQLGYHGSGLYWPTGTSINASYYYNCQNMSSGQLVVEDMTPFVIPPGIILPEIQKSFSLHDGVMPHLNGNKRQLQSHHWRATSLSDEGPNEVETFHITINDDVYSAVLLKSSYGDPTVCQGSLCCSAGYEGTIDNEELYAIGAFDGLHTSGETYYLQACVFIKCATMSRESCGRPTKSSSSYMSKMSFSGNFSTSFVYPEVLTDQDGLPGLVTSIWYYQDAILIDAGLYGGPLSISMLARDYSRDP